MWYRGVSRYRCGPIAWIGQCVIPGNQTTRGSFCTSRSWKSGTHGGPMRTLSGSRQSVRRGTKQWVIDGSSITSRTSPRSLAEGISSSSTQRIQSRVQSEWTQPTGRSTGSA